MTTSSPKIIVFGCKTTTKFIVDFLGAITKIEHVITIPPEIAARNQVADYLDLTDFAAEKGLPLYQARTYNLASEEDRFFLNALSADVAFVIGWQRLIPEVVLESFSVGCFGMHGSALNLPLGRGRSPMNWSIIEGRKVFYTNLFKYDAGIDSGKVLDTYKFTINDRDTAETMHYKNMLAMKFLIEKNLRSVVANEFALREQPDVAPTFYPKRTPDDSIIDWDNDVFAIERFIRAVAPPFGGAFTFLNGARFTIYDSQIFDIEDFGYQDAASGTIIEVLSPSKLLVKGYGGLLLINAFECDEQPRKGDKFNNNGQPIRIFPTNRFGNFDQF